ncbi:STM3941 family protein [Sneathiella sp.]|uniref:STM3941 family protein n=1 Tax=Sneathiella sp. TaxID=1964365 RepID=UPI0030036DEB
MNNEPILEIRYSRVKCALLLSLSVLIVIPCLWLLKIDPGNILNSFIQGIKEQEIGWVALAGLILFVFLGLFYLKAILDRRIQIRIDKNGLYLRRDLNQTISWQDIDTIYLTSGFFPFYSKWLPTANFVNLTVKNPSKYRKTGLTALLSGLNKGLSKGDFNLAPLLFEISRNNLLDTLQSAHQKYAPIPNPNSKDK